MTIPANDFHYFEQINALVQQEPVEALDPEIMGSLAAIGIVKGKQFNPDARMRNILTDAAAVGTATARTLNWHPREAEGFGYYPNSAWTKIICLSAVMISRPRRRSSRKRESNLSRPPVIAPLTRGQRCSSMRQA